MRTQIKIQTLYILVRPILFKGEYYREENIAVFNTKEDAEAHKARLDKDLTNTITKARKCFLENTSENQIISSQTISDSMAFWILDKDNYLDFFFVVPQDIIDTWPRDENGEVEKHYQGYSAHDFNKQMAILNEYWFDPIFPCIIREINYFNKRKFFF